MKRLILALVVLAGVVAAYRYYMAPPADFVPEIRTVAKGALAAWMKSRSMLGGQHKVPRIVNDPKLFQNLISFLKLEL